MSFKYALPNTEIKVNINIHGTLLSSLSILFFLYTKYWDTFLPPTTYLDLLLPKNADLYTMSCSFLLIE